MIGTPSRQHRRRVYEHCCRALDRALTRGAHGLPLIGSGDWNDGMNRVGQGGRGESVWLGFFLHTRARTDCCRFARAAATTSGSRGTPPNAQRLGDSAQRRRLGRRAGIAAPTTTTATPLGSTASDECQIDALAQAWAVLSGVAPRERADMAMAAVERAAGRREAAA